MGHASQYNMDPTVVLGSCVMSYPAVIPLPSPFSSPQLSASPPYIPINPLTSRFVVLDAYDISLVGWADDHPKAMAARELLDEKNPNKDKNIPDGLRGLDR